jgi:hypothetical protein
VAATWPLDDTLPPGSLANRGSRRPEWALDDSAEDISLVVNRELVTNAVRAFTDADGPPSYTDASPASPSCTCACYRTTGG